MPQGSREGARWPNRCSSSSAQDKGGRQGDSSQLCCKDTRPPLPKTPPGRRCGALCLSVGGFNEQLPRGIAACWSCLCVRWTFATLPKTVKPAETTLRLQSLRAASTLHYSSIIQRSPSSAIASPLSAQAYRIYDHMLAWLMHGEV